MNFFYIIRPTGTSNFLTIVKKGHIYIKKGIVKKTVPVYSLVIKSSRNLFRQFVSVKKLCSLRTVQNL